MSQLWNYYKSQLSPSFISARKWDTLPRTTYRTTDRYTATYKLRHDKWPTNFLITILLNGSGETYRDWYGRDERRRDCKDISLERDTSTEQLKLSDPGRSQSMAGPPFYGREEESWGDVKGGGSCKLTTTTTKSGDDWRCTPHSRTASIGDVNEAKGEVVGGSGVSVSVGGKFRTNSIIQIYILTLITFETF